MSIAKVSVRARRAVSVEYLPERVREKELSIHEEWSSSNQEVDSVFGLLLWLCS